jgi:hypothetical protein
LAAGEWLTSRAELVNRQKAPLATPSDIEPEAVTQISCALKGDLFEEPIQISQIGHIAPHGRDVLSDLLYGLIQLSLPTSSDKHECSFGDESLRSGESDSATSSGDDGNFPFQRWHVS